MSVTESPRRNGFRATPQGRRDRRSLCECYPAIASSVPVARRAVAEFAAAAGASADLVHAIRLAASEALTNAVKYAYPGTDGSIDVNAWHANGELWLLITDDGCGLRAGRESDGLGQGLALISQTADDLLILERSSGGTELRMRFDLAGSEDHPRGSFASATRPASPRFSTTR
jgi:anti-sigma regulatory factor (Ser/Thr protein kinase)